MTYSLVTYYLFLKETYYLFLVRDVLNCLLLDGMGGESNYTVTEKYDNYRIVDKVIDGSDVIIIGKIVDDFNILDKNYTRIIYNSIRII